MILSSFIIKLYNTKEYENANNKTLYVNNKCYNSCPA